MAKLFSIICLLGITAFRSPSAGTGEINLVVKNIDVKRGGKLMVGVFGKATFPQDGKQLFGSEWKVVTDVAKVSFSDVPVGTYAVAVYQDIDNNGLLETNFVGLPQEPIGFSRDARIFMGPPAFEKAMFNVESDKSISISITLR